VKPHDLTSKASLYKAIDLILRLLYFNNNRKADDEDVESWDLQEPGEVAC